MTNSPTVYILDDDQPVRESMKWLLESAGYASRCFVDAKSFFQAVQPGSEQCVGCLLLDLRLPDVEGLELLEQHPELPELLPVIIITGHGDVRAAVRAMKAGAVDFIEKPFDEHTLLETVAKTINQARQQQQWQQRRLQYKIRLERLSARERQVMRRVVEGCLNKQIAADLELSPKTVEVHRSQVMRKMEARSLAELVRMAVELDEELSEEQA